MSHKTMRRVTRPLQLTVRNLGPELERRLREVALREEVSLNRAAVRLMRRGAGVTQEGTNAIGAALDPFIGTWSKEEERELLERIALCEQIDLAMWK